MTEAALRALEQHSFTGNVRELENILERAVALSDNHTIDIADLGLYSSQRVLSQANSNGSVQSMDTSERRELIEALDKTRWNRKAAAQALGLTYRQLRYRIKQLGIEDHDQGAA